jgi:repressor LexA
MSRPGLRGLDGLTDRQREIFRWIRAYVDREGFAPSMREIGAGVGIGSTNAVSDVFRALEREGFILRKSRLDGNSTGRARALIITPKGRAAA